METIMGYRKVMDYNSVHHQIQMSGVELYSGRNDGFTDWETKKELYQLKFLIDAILKDSGTFVGEEEFLKEYEQKEVWRTLKK